jgi:nitrogen fixation NifU-like protein
MSDRFDDWKDLYRESEQPETHLGPVLFYSPQVMDHTTNPRNVGEMEDADGFSATGDPACGDQTLLWIKVKGNRIIDIKFKCFGCPGAISTSSMVTVLAEGKTLEKAKLLTDDEVIQALGGIPERKRHCSLMGIKGLRSAIQDYERKKRGDSSKD